MKKVLVIVCLFALSLGLAGCESKLNVNEQGDGGTGGIINNENVEDNDSKTDNKNEVVEIEGLITVDEEDLMLISNGQQIELASEDYLMDYVDKKVQVSGEYNIDNKLEINELKIWEEGRLFYSVGNLYLTQNDGSHILLEGSVVQELIEKYITRRAKILGKFVDKKNYKLRVVEYYIQNTTSDVYKLYENDKYGFSVKYPMGWAVTEKPAEDIGAFNVIFGKDKEDVILTIQKDIPKPALSDDKIEKKVLPSGIVVNIYYDEDAKEGKSINKVMFNLPDSNYDFYFAGYGPIFNQMYQTIELKNGL